MATTRSRPQPSSPRSRLAAGSLASSAAHHPEARGALGKSPRLDHLFVATVPTQDFESPLFMMKTAMYLKHSHITRIAPHPVSSVKLSLDTINIAKGPWLKLLVKV